MRTHVFNLLVSMMKTRFFFSYSACLGPAFIGLLLCLGFVLGPQAARADAPKLIPAAQLQEDFRALYKTLADSQYDLFHRTPKAEYDQAFQSMLQELQQPMTSLAARRYFQRFAALAKTAHTRIDFPVDAYREFLAQGGKTLPLYLDITDAGVFVDEYYGEPDLLNMGTQVLAVNGQDIESFLLNIYRYISADNAALLQGLAGPQFPPLLWWHEGQRENYQLTVMDERGESRVITVPTLSRQQQEKYAEQNTNKDESSEALREQRMLGEHIAYLKPGPFYHAEGENIWDTQAFHAFIDKAFNTFIDAGATELIIDLRNNPGGTNSFSDHMLAWFANRPFKFAADFRVKVSQAAIDSNQARLDVSTDQGDLSYQLASFYQRHPLGETFSFPLPDSQPHAEQHFGGKIFVLIDRYSYSNAVSVAAIVKDYDFGIVLGEKTADLATTHGAMEHFTLPNTGMTVGFPKALIVRPNGSLEPDGVVPDIPLDFSQSKHEGDPVLNQVIGVVRKARLTKAATAQ